MGGSDGTTSIGLGEGDDGTTAGAGDGGREDGGSDGDDAGLNDGGGPMQHTRWQSSPPKQLNRRLAKLKLLPSAHSNA